MPFLAEDLKRFQAHMVAKAAPNGGVCAVCANTTWTADGPLTLLGLTQGSDGTISGVDPKQAMPLIVTTCTKCGHARFFSWLTVMEDTAGG